MPKILSPDEIQTGLTTFKTQWKHIGSHIETEVETKDFAAGLKLLNQIGEIAESMDHHPDLLLHGYNKLKITTSTHSEGGLTKNDLELASKLDSCIQSAHVD